ncbi:MAG: DUF5674 family protein [Patescibacteria group bacterium]
MDIRIIETTISLNGLRDVAEEFYGDMVKGAVDIGKGIAAFGGEYHIDASNLLVEHGSRQGDIWGFNILLDQSRETWIEYTSLINIRPQAGNRGMEVMDAKVRDRMKKILDALIV